MGKIYFIINEGVVFVDEFIIGSKVRGMGIGKKLFNKMENLAREKGCHKIHLYTGKGWKAEEFYKLQGYKKTADLPNHFVNKDFIEYTKYL